MNFDDLHKQKIEKIRDVINPHPNIVLEVLTDKIVKIVLTEPTAELKKVTLYGFDEEKTFAFKLDAKDESDMRKNLRISEYLNPNAQEDINKGCDGIIFTYINGMGYVFLCEMKSGNPKQTDYLQQFRNSSVFVKFISVILNEFYECNLEEFQIKYILFDKKKNFEKTETTQKKIKPKKESYQGKEWCVYRIHHPNENRSLNIKSLDLSNDCA